jgi:hypothetical protein
LVCFPKASLSAARITPSTPVIVTADVFNSGTANGSTMVKLYVNGQEESSKGVAVNGGSNTTVTFSVTRNEPGNYAVYVGGTQASSFTVDQFVEPNIILYISMACIFFSLVAGVFYVLRKREQYW